MPKSYQPDFHDLRKFPSVEPRSGRADPFSNTFQHYPILSQSHSNRSFEPSNQTRIKAGSHPSPQSGTIWRPARALTDPRSNTYSNISPQAQTSPKSLQKNNSDRRQNQSRRPQVRLPDTVHTSTPTNHLSRHSGSTRSDTNSMPSQYTEIPSRVNLQGKSNSSRADRIHTRRHRHSNSNSSKTSAGSVSWSAIPSNKASTQPSTQPSSPEFPAPWPPSPLACDNDLRENEEWLLIRDEMARAPRTISRDKYEHIHPLVRNYASQMVPGLKMGEPLRANSVMSRRWQLEETLEKDKREFQSRKQGGAASPPRRLSCMTKEQDRMYALAQQTLALLKGGKNTKVQTEDNSEYNLG